MITNKPLIVTCSKCGEKYGHTPFIEEAVCPKCKNKEWDND